MKLKRKARRKNFILQISAVLISIAVISVITAVIFTIYMKQTGPMHKADEKNQETQPSNLLLSYMEYLSDKDYEKMYEMLDTETAMMTKEEFIQRNSSIYEGIEMQDMELEITEYNKETQTVYYQTSFDTIAGEICFENEAAFMEREDGFRLIWDDSLIFPGLRSSDKVRVSVITADRGNILDRSGRVLAGWGTAACAGIVPGKLESDDQLGEIARLLETDVKAVEKKLEAKWVKKDSFVPVKTIPAVKELDLMKEEPDEAVLKEKERQKKLLEIPGVMITETKVREYPLGEAASHLTGYIQNVTAEDLEEHAKEGYTANSMIGKSGIEGLFEKELKGQNGCRIYITDKDGTERKELLRTEVQHGQDIRLTIDAGLQKQLYGQFKDDKSCSVAVSPYTGEVLALVSTPSFDSNDFIMGMSQEQWEILSEDENKPLFNRFRQKWCPGSTFKPVIAAAGLTEGSLNPDEDLGSEGLSWQKSVSWGGYFVTTLHAADPAVLEQAIVCSDNIYFAKAALKIGAQKLEQSLRKLGFGSPLPFEITMAQAQYSNTEKIETEIQLADSGYGQGQILMNPLHLACIYTAFCNGGSIIKPYLVYRPDAEAQVWINQAFEADSVQRVLDAMKKVINNPEGTGYGLHRDDIELAGKTGTAEIKDSKEDRLGTELGWMAVFTSDETVKKPVLIVSMTEDVKGRGGSGYVVQKERAVLEYWFSDTEQAAEK